MSLERMRFDCSGELNCFNREREDGCGECVMCALRSVDDPDLPVPYVLTEQAKEYLDRNYPRCECGLVHTTTFD